MSKLQQKIVVVAGKLRIKRSKRRSKAPSVSKLMKGADKAFSLQVRQRGANGEGINTCYTCGFKNHWKKLHCGHFLSRFYKAARWDFDNARPQCVMCNMWKKGDIVTFRTKLIAEIGLERVEAVEAKRNVSTKLTVPFLQELLTQLELTSTPNILN